MHAPFEKSLRIERNTGKQIEQIAVAGPWTGNITFGGKNRDLLFITASKNVYG